MRRCLYIAAFLYALSAGQVSESRPIPATLEEVTNYADLIVYASVTSPDEIDSTNVSIRVREVIAQRLDSFEEESSVEKGSVLTIDTKTAPLTESPLSPKLNYVLFLVRCKHGYRPIFGGAGRVHVTSAGVAYTADLLREKEQQEYSEFIERVRRIPLLPTLGAVPRSWLCKS